MFEVKKPDMVNKTFRIPSELIRQLECLAQTKGVSLNNLVIQCCEYAINNINVDENKADK